MCLICECVCCPVNKNCCNYPLISLMTAKEWLAVLSPPTVPLQQLILYIRYCKHMTMGTPPRLEGDLLSQHVPCHCFGIISASVLGCSFDLIFDYFFFWGGLIFAWSCTHVWILGTVPWYSSSLWVFDDSCQKCPASDSMQSVFTCTILFWQLFWKKKKKGKYAKKGFWEGCCQHEG